jgi:hypothetical protein
MNARVYFILGFTFITGMFAGAYMYVTSFAPDYQQSDVEVLSEIDFKLQGQMTGGCQMIGVCPSFVLNENRTYEYVPQYQLQAGGPETVEGKLDTESFKALVEKVRGANMEILTTKNSLNCDSYVDGIDYNYRLTHEGEVYELSTCGMNFKNSGLDGAFSPLWGRLATSSGATSGSLENGVSGFLRDSLDKQFEYDDN